jgi:transposase
MLIVETIAKIRRDYHVQHKGLKTIARERGLSRNTVRKVIRSDVTELTYERREPAFPRLGPFIEELDALLSENGRRARRERLTLMRICEQLRANGYTGGYDSVRRYARRWRMQQATLAAPAFVPLQFDPGEAYQFDWSHEYVVMAGRAYPRETQEMVFDAHNKAFAFFGGSCSRGIYDNMTTAVETVFVGKERRFNRRFERMCSHYLVEPVACTPAAGWEKGQVENQVGVVRERFFSPRLRVKSYAELNAWLADRCLEYARTNRHPERKDLTIAQAWAAERPMLIGQAGPFDGFHETTVSVSKTCLVRFDNNRYSVTATAVGRPVQVQAYADRVVIRQDGIVVGEHERRFGRDQIAYDPWHYVPVLKRKPGALRNGAPFRDWPLPASIERVRRRLFGTAAGDRQMVAVLSAVLSDGLEAVEDACAEALRAGVCSADVILNILARRRPTADPGRIDVPDALSLTSVPMADCARYDRLRPRSEAADGAA